jgi:predicted aldo/keto reductase-like oxidoreductase
VELIDVGGTDLQLSPVGMGTAPMVTRVPNGERVALVRAILDMGVNWFDTAHAYGDSESVLGEALAEARERVAVVTKSASTDPETLREHIAESLRSLRTDYIDVFLFHGGGAVRAECWDGPGGLRSAAEDARREGKIRYLGFSAHSVSLACEAVQCECFDFAMVPANFISTQYVEGPFMDAARRRGVTVIAMKPFGGGRIDDPGLCLRYLKQFEGLLPCLGVDRREHMAENLRLWTEGGVVSAKDAREMARIRAELGEGFCRQCGYCLPCPEGVPIMSLTMMEAWTKQLSADALAAHFGGAVEKARSCIRCRECVERCPYDLSIPDLLTKGISLFEKTTARR